VTLVVHRTATDEWQIAFTAIRQWYVRSHRKDHIHASQVPVMCAVTAVVRPPLAPGGVAICYALIKLQK